MRKIRINLEIANALIWATIIIASSLITEDNENIFNILLAGATLTFLWVDKIIQQRKIRCAKK